MKTAMQQLIDKLSDFKKELSDKYDADPYVTKVVSIAIGEANKLLEEEKRQIEKAYVSGGIDGVLIGLANGDSRNFKGSNDYYNQTYNNENNTTRQST